jgi:membrane associated rhomboid family serine protease
VQRLIFWNVGLFILPLIFFILLWLSGEAYPRFDWRRGTTDNLFSVSPDFNDLLYKPWSLITYAFLHSTVLHLLFNMLMLVFAGRLFLTFFTQKQFFGLYLLSAIFSGLVFIAGDTFIPIMRIHPLPMVGASAAIMAILIGAAVYAPQYEVRLMLIGRVRLWHVALALVALDLIYISAENTGGHLAHLAGALFGYLYIVLLKQGTDLSKGVSTVLDFFADLFKPRKSTPFKKVHKNPQPQQRPAGKPKDMTQKQIDEILDKISKSGYDSLTKEEKDFLFKVGK